MKLNEYLAKNAVKLMIKGYGEKNPTRQTNDLGMYDYSPQYKLSRKPFAVWWTAFSF